MERSRVFYGFECDPKGRQVDSEALEFFKGFRPSGTVLFPAGTVRAENWDIFRNRTIRDLELNQYGEIYQAAAWRVNWFFLEYGGEK